MIAKALGINLSALLENAVLEEAKRRILVFENVHGIEVVAPAGFEPASPDPESGRIDRYPTGLRKQLTPGFIKILVMAVEANQEPKKAGRLSLPSSNKIFLNFNKENMKTMPSISRIQKIKEYLSKRRISQRKKVGVLVDGPNMLRKEFNINLREIREILSEYGDIKIAKVFLNQYATEKLVEAIENQGFEPIVTSGDVDVRLAVEAMELIYNDSIDAIAMVTRDADFKAVLMKAMEMGKETIIIGAEPGFSTALKNAADIAIVLNEEEEHEAKQDEEELIEV